MTKQRAVPPDPKFEEVRLSTFAQARQIVDKEIGASKPRGFEDDDAFLVLLVDPPLDDTVVLVSKADGTVHRVPTMRPGVDARLQKMRPTA